MGCRSSPTTWRFTPCLQNIRWRSRGGLQIALGQIRRTSGDFAGKLLAIDPHRTRSYSKRQMRRFRDDQKVRAYKVAPTFFALDADTHQPVCFTIATSAQTATRAAIDLLEQAAEILASPPGKTLVLADIEHLSVELFQHVQLHTPFDLLVPMRNERSLQKQLRAIPSEQFTRRWAGFATMKQPYKMASYAAGPFFQFVQRTGERQPDAYRFGAFLSTTDRDEVDALTLDYPKRWHVEEFFNAHQALGWNRAGTMNLNIRYGQMTMALIAQAALHRIRRLLDEPYSTWDADSFRQVTAGGLGGRHPGQRRYDHRDLLQRPQRRPTSAALRGASRAAARRTHRPACPLVVRL